MSARAGDIRVKSVADGVQNSASCHARSCLGGHSATHWAWLTTPMRLWPLTPPHLPRLTPHTPATSYTCMQVLIYCPTLSLSRQARLDLTAKVVRNVLREVDVRDELSTKLDGSVLLLELGDTGLNLGTEVLHQALDRPGSGVTKSADGVALDLLTARGVSDNPIHTANDHLRELEEHVNLTLLGATLNHAVHHVHHPGGTLTAGGALATRLVLVEFGETGNGADHVGRVVHDNDGSCSERGSVVLERVVVHQALLGSLTGDDGDRATAGDDTLEVAPATTDTTAVLLEQLLERDRHLLLDNTRVVDVARDTEELGAGVALTTEASEPSTTTTGDRWGDGDSLDVGDGRGAAKETDVGGERRLKTGLALLALERLDKSSLLTTDVGTGTTVEVDVKVVARTAGVLADEASSVGLVNGLLDVVGLLDELSTDVDVG